MIRTAPSYRGARHFGKRLCGNSGVGLCAAKCPHSLKRSSRSIL